MEMNFNRTDRSNKTRKAIEDSQKLIYSRHGSSYHSLAFWKFPFKSKEQWRCTNRALSTANWSIRSDLEYFIFFLPGSECKYQTSVITLLYTRLIVFVINIKYIGSKVWNSAHSRLHQAISHYEAFPLLYRGLSFHRHGRCRARMSRH